MATAANGDKTAAARQQRKAADLNLNQVIVYHI